MVRFGQHIAGQSTLKRYFENSTEMKIKEEENAYLENKIGTSAVKHCKYQSVLETG